MASDTLILGPFTFDGFSPPSEMPFGGRQEIKVHRMPGGAREVHVMGADDHDPRWSGILYGDTAFSDMMTLDAMRKAGQELAFVWGAEARTVVISEFRARVEKPNLIHYEICLIYTDSSALTSAPGLSLASMAISDLVSAAGIGGAS